MIQRALLIAVCFFVFACTSQKTTDAVFSQIISGEENTTIAVSLVELKKAVVKHAIEEFKKDVEENKADADELSLRDHPFRYQGKIRAPLLSENATFALLEKEYGKRKTESTGPVDVLEETPTHFLLVYRQNIYEGTKKAEGVSTLKVLHTPLFQPVVEELKAKQASLKGPLWFESFIIDFDKALKEAKRDLQREHAIATNN